MVAFGLLSGIHLAEGHLRYRQEEGHIRLRKQATKDTEHAHQHSDRLQRRSGRACRPDELLSGCGRLLGQMGVKMGVLAAGGSAASQSKSDNKYEASLRLRRLKGPTLVRWLFKALGALLILHVAFAAAALSADRRRLMLSFVQAITVQSEAGNDLVLGQLEQAMCATDGAGYLVEVAVQGALLLAQLHLAMKRNAASHHGHTSESHFAMLAAAALLLPGLLRLRGR